MLSIMVVRTRRVLSPLRMTFPEVWSQMMLLTSNFREDVVNFGTNLYHASASAPAHWLMRRMTNSAGLTGARPTSMIN